MTRSEWTFAASGTARIILCFVRHLGCAFCHQQVAALQAISAKLAEDDVHVVVVSLGTKMQAKFFRVRGQVSFINGEHARARARARAYFLVPCVV